jgi:hypothetical protein
MANRNLSQLPENTDPQVSDWLLGASGNSPSVLQKMAVGNIKSASSGSGGSIKFALPINENHTLARSGYYFTDAIAANIEIDCSSLEIGDHILWVNLSNKNLLFKGLNSINSTVIPDNKGIIVFPSKYIEFFFYDDNKNIKNINGDYLINMPISVSASPSNTIASPIRGDSSLNDFFGGNYGIFNSYLAGQFLKTTFTNPTKVNQVKFQSPIADGGARSPREVWIQSSQDSTEWTTEFTYANSTSTDIKIINLNSEKFALYWRLYQASNTLAPSYPWHMANYSMTGLSYPI